VTYLQGYWVKTPNSSPTPPLPPLLTEADKTFIATELPALFTLPPEEPKPLPPPPLSSPSPTPEPLAKDKLAGLPGDSEIGIPLRIPDPVLDTLMDLSTSSSSPSPDGNDESGKQLEKEQTKVAASDPVLDTLMDLSSEEDSPTTRPMKLIIDDDGVIDLTQDDDD
jgi:hypothetical protein